MAKVEKERIPLTKKGLKADLDAGLTRPEIAKKYDLSVGMIKKALKDCGLDKQRAANKGYIIVPDDDEPAIEAHETDQNVAEA